MPPAARPSARHRSAVAVFLLAFILAGFFALGRLPVDPPPSREGPRLNLLVSAPGLSAPVLEPMLTQGLEQLLAGIPGVASVDSVTTAGSVTAGLRLSRRRDIDPVQREVLARLDRAAASWPDSVDPPVLTLADDASKTAEFVLASRTLDALALRDWVEAEFVKRLRELPGVAAVEVEGGAVREILVMPDQRRLAGYGLSFEDLLRAIRKNPEMDSLPRPTPRKGRSRREPVQPGNLAAVAALPVILPGGESIQLAEVARLTLSHEPGPAAFRVDGAEAVKVTVNRQPRAALSEVAEGVRSHVDWMRANRLIPDSVALHSFVNYYDQAARPFRKTAYALFAGFVLVLAAVHLLGGRGRRTFLFGVMVAAAVQGVFIAMALSGATLDVTTLGALALGTGLFGGSVTLMFANSGRPAPVPRRGVPPVIAAAVVMAAALAPVWFAGGELNLLYREPVSVYLGAWLMAALLAWWLVPMFDARHRRQENSPWRAAVRHAVSRMGRYYDALLRYLLPRSVPVLAVSALVLAVLTGVLIVKGRMPVTLETSGREIVWRLQGPDSAQLTALADAVVQRLRALPVLREANHFAQAMREEWVLRLDEERARELGVDLAMAGKALAIAVNGIPAGSFRDAERRYDVRMRLPPEDAGGASAGKILLLGELENRPAVHVRDIAVLERASVPAEIRRHDGKPEIGIIALPADGFAPERVAAAMKTALDETVLPSGYRLSAGRRDEIAPDNRSLVMSGLAVLLVFAALALLHRSPQLALAATLPPMASLMATGAALLFFGVPPSPPVWLGILLLLGVSAGHAGALLAPGERPPGRPWSPRLLRQTVRHRFRPLFIMVLTAVLGMLPLTWINAGAPALSILVAVLATGLVLSLPINLLLTPLTYWLLTRKEQTPASRRL